MNSKFSLAATIFLSSCGASSHQDDIDLNYHDMIIREGESPTVEGGIVLSYWGMEKLKREDYEKWSRYMIDLLNHDSFKVREQASSKLRRETIETWIGFAPDDLSTEQEARIGQIRKFHSK